MCENISIFLEILSKLRTIKAERFCERCHKLKYLFTLTHYFFQAIKTISISNAAFEKKYKFDPTNER
jgi:hypothetical protein